jgi:hypothetical protein
MLLLELLFMDGGLSPDDSPSIWSCEPLQRRFAAWQARSDSGCLHALSHLHPATLFTLPEPDRPSSMELAAALGLSLPTKPLLRRMTRAWSSTPAVLSNSLSSTPFKRLAWQSTVNRSRPGPTTLNFIIPWRWSRPQGTTLWQDLRLALKQANAEG